MERLALEDRAGGEVHLPRGITVHRSHGMLFLEVAAKGAAVSCCRRLDGPGVYDGGPGDCRVEIRRVEPSAFDPSVPPAFPWSAHVDGDRVSFPLWARNFRPGDRFVPLGMTGQKKLKDFFSDRKVPAHVRRVVPLIVQGETVVWVAGLRLDERFRVRASTRRVLELTVHGGQWWKERLLAAEGKSGWQQT
jgi:tRNA(Ile)-lysidine synthase